MKKLLLEQSRKIVTKFLKHFGVYDEKKVDNYFNSSACKQYLEIKKPDIKNAKEKDLKLGSKFFMNSISYVASQACKTLFKNAGKQVSRNNKAYRISHGSLFNDINLPKETKNLRYKDILKKYDDYLEIFEENNDNFSLIIENLEKITNKDIFAVSDFWENDRCDLYKHVLMFKIDEFTDRKRISNPVDNNMVYEQKIYLFPDDLSFLIIMNSDACGDLIASTRETIKRIRDDLKHKYYDKLIKLKVGDKIVVNSKVYKIKKIEIDKHYNERYIYFNKTKGLLFDLYDLDMFEIRDDELYTTYERINSIELK